MKVAKTNKSFSNQQHIMINNQSAESLGTSSKQSPRSTKRRKRQTLTIRPQLSLQDHIKLWNVEGIEGSSAVKLNLKQPEHSNYFESAQELKTARRKVIQKLIKENIE